jgi:hypothetical protein
VGWSIRCATVIALAIVGGARVASAQPATVQETRVVEGRVVRPFVEPSSGAAPKTDSIGLATVPNAMVTLHRVGRDGQGPLDSTRTNAAGQYRFSFQVSGSSDAIYFTSVTFGGVAYFTTPLRTSVVRGADAEITVFDTTTRAFPLTISGRHLIVSAADTNNERTIVEVFELSNDSVLTLVAGDKKTGKPTWSVAVPPEARNFKVGEGGEVSPDAITFEDGHVSMFSPIAPGLKQLSFSYHLPVRSFPLPVVIEHGAVVLEVLLEEALGSATGGGLAAADPVALENRNFRRFLAQGVTDGATITLALPSGPSVGRNLYVGTLLGTIGVAMLLILLRAMQRRRPVAYGTPMAVRAREVPMADKLAREIADLDATYAQHDNPSDSLRAAYDARRAELKDALAAEIARK